MRSFVTAAEERLATASGRKETLLAKAEIQDLMSAQLQLHPPSIIKKPGITRNHYGNSFDSKGSHPKAVRFRSIVREENELSKIRTQLNYFWQRLANPQSLKPAEHQKLKQEYLKLILKYAPFVRNDPEEFAKVAKTIEILRSN
jgi:hypothetical protein